MKQFSCTNPTQFIVQTALIAALYAAATLVTMFVLQGLAFGPIQLRVSEALVVLALFTPAAIPGLTLGCVIANLVALVMNGLGALGLLDVIFGSFATFLGALWCWKLRSKTFVALLGPVLANALIVPAYLPFLLQGLGFYSIPFTDISLDGIYLSMYLFGLVSIAISESLVVYLLGFPLVKMFAGMKGTNKARD